MPMLLKEIDYDLALQSVHYNFSDFSSDSTERFRPYTRSVLLLGSRMYIWKNVVIIPNSLIS